MPEPDLFQILTSRIKRVGLRYMVTEALASIIYSGPRLVVTAELRYAVS